MAGEITIKVGHAEIKLVGRVETVITDSYTMSAQGIYARVGTAKPMIAFYPWSQVKEVLLPEVQPQREDDTNGSEADRY